MMQAAIIHNMVKAREKIPHTSPNAPEGGSSKKVRQIKSVVHIIGIMGMEKAKPKGTSILGKVAPPPQALPILRFSQENKNQVPKNSGGEKNVSQK
jgi:hypothetical protein